MSQQSAVFSRQEGPQEGPPIAFLDMGTGGTTRRALAEALEEAADPPEGPRLEGIGEVEEEGWRRAGIPHRPRGEKIKTQSGKPEGQSRQTNGKHVSVSSLLN